MLRFSRALFTVIRVSVQKPSSEGKASQLFQAISWLVVDGHSRYVGSRASVSKAECEAFRYEQHAARPVDKEFRT